MQQRRDSIKRIVELETATHVLRDLMSTTRSARHLDALHGYTIRSELLVMLGNYGEEVLELLHKEQRSNVFWI